MSVDSVLVHSPCVEFTLPVLGSKLLPTLYGFHANVKFQHIESN